ncbi:MAG: hypothetical protein HY599_04215 [Candidatus Omnitrophica bacterium]|nr:hypothetical protein [Candidatus Omnitrophota bacterium]
MNEAQLRTLYCEQRLSMMEIAQRLSTTHATVLYWLKKHAIQRRSWSESTYAKRNPIGDPFTIPDRLSPEQEALLQAGLLLYWAEGTKGGPSLQIANLDPRMLQLFVKFLRLVCRIHEQRLYVYVRVHRSFSRTAARRYWSRLLSIVPTRVHVYMHTDTRGKRKQWSPYGLATLEFHNSKLKRWLEQAINEYVEQQLQTSRTDPRYAWLVKDAEGTYALN